MVAPALLFDVELPAPFALEALLGVFEHAQQAQVTHALGDHGVGRDDGAAFAGGDVLSALKAEADDIAGSANGPALEAAAESVCRVFDDAQTAACCEGAHCREVAGAAGVVHGHDRFRAGCNAALGIGNV